MIDFKIGNELPLTKKQSRQLSDLANKKKAHQETIKMLSAETIDIDYAIQDLLTEFFPDVLDSYTLSLKTSGRESVITVVKLLNSDMNAQESDTTEV